MKLTEQLMKLEEEILSKIPAEDAALIKQTTAELIQSGILSISLRQGDKAPDFVLPDANGEMVHFSQLLGRGPVVVNFYRGVW
jgi:hypothetical protein